MSGYSLYMEVMTSSNLFQGGSIPDPSGGLEYQKIQSIYKGNIVLTIRSARRRSLKT